MTETASTRITSSPSSPSTSDAARVVSAAPRPIEMSRMTSTTVWIAIPPRMFPIAIPRLCDSAAETTIAISGRFVAIASRIAPPSASPRPSRVSSTSVEPERWMPATQTAPAATAKIRTSGASPRPENTGQFYSARRPGCLGFDHHDQGPRQTEEARQESSTEVAEGKAQGEEGQEGLRPDELLALRGYHFERRPLRLV